MLFSKPTIALVNGWCFGGAFTPLVACDLALAASEAVPAAELRERTRELAVHLASLSPAVLHPAKVGFKRARTMEWEVAEEYLYATLDQSVATDPEGRRERGLREFLDRRSFRLGLGAYRRD